MAKLTVRRKAYTRKGFTAHRGKTVYTVKPTHIPATTFKQEDIGAPGRGEKIIPIRGKMDGYSTSLSAPKRHAILRKLVKREGVAPVFHRLHAMVIMRKRAQPVARAVFEKDRKWVTDAFGTKALTPKAAIRKWKRMSPAARSKAMPGGKI